MEINIPITLLCRECGESLSADVLKELDQDEGPKIVVEVSKCSCSDVLMGPPCDGGCGGIGEHEIDSENYCTGCLIGAYTLNTNALKRCREIIKELKEKQQ